jgi:hypothetical protein
MPVLKVLNFRVLAFEVLAVLNRSKNTTEGGYMGQNFLFRQKDLTYVHIKSQFYDLIIYNYNASVAVG